MAKAVRKKTTEKKSAATAIVERQSPLINLVGADIWFDDPELAGLAVWQIRGDSMSDTLRRGDFVLIDTEQTKIGGGGIFAVLREDCMRVIIKQVEMSHEDGHPPGRIKCTPRNPSYQTFELTLGKDARIIGRVVQKITRRL
jgi:phage repressor protein C with HTH and peptisase S24 domain